MSMFAYMTSYQAIFPLSIYIYIYIYIYREREGGREREKEKERVNGWKKEVT